MTKIFELLARLLPTPTVDRYVSALNKVAAGLAKAEAAQVQRANDLAAQSAAIGREALAAREEADRAGRVAAKLNALTA